MVTQHKSPPICVICEKKFPKRALIPIALVGLEMTKTIKKTHPKLNNSNYICHNDLNVIRARYITTLLSSEKGELTKLEHSVLKSLNDQEALAASLEAQSEQKWTLSERMADKIASFGGSWRFISIFAIFLFAWMAVNSLFIWAKPLDPYPYIFLNLILSCVAAIQAPVIMMSQNRQEARDRTRSQNDYEINLKAELEIRNLHDKIDHLLSHQWDRMVKIQQIQLEILSELTERKKT